MKNHSAKIFLIVILLLMVSIPVFAIDCKSIRSEYLKERHRCIGLFREAYAPEKQPLSGDIQMTDVGVNMCFANLKSDYPEFSDGGECVGVEEENVDKKFEGYSQKCLHQKDFSECGKALENVKSVDNVRNSDGATLLMIAAQEGDVDAMDFLLPKGASAKRVDHNAWTLLHYALNPPKEQFDENSDTNVTILTAVSKILALGVHPQELNLSGWATLCSAIHHNLSNGVVEILLKAGANPNLRCPVGEERWTPLFFTILRNDLEKIQLLLNAGADPNVESLRVSEKGYPWNQAPLLFAIQLRNTKIVKILVDAGANVNYELKIDTLPLPAIPILGIAMVIKANDWSSCNNCNNDKCSEKCLTSKESTEIVEILENAGAIIPFRKGLSSSFWMQANLTEKMVYDAIKQGADVNESGSSGETPLHSVAMHCKNPKAMLALIKKGALVNAMTKTGDTPLLRAAMFNPNPAFIKILINAGADINAEDSNKWNALKIAVIYNNPEVVTLLLKTKLGRDLSDFEKNLLVGDAAVLNLNGPMVLETLLKNGFSAKPVGSGKNKRDPLLHALKNKKDAEIIKLLLQNGGVVDNECMQLARDLPMNTPEERKYRNQMIDLLTKYKK